MLQGKTAFVTGASRGIGKAIAIQFASLGANVVVNYRNSINAVQEVVAQCEAYGVKVLAVQGDVSDFESVEKMVDAAVKEFGRIDILVNNAGITKDMLLLRMKEEDFDAVIDINLKGAFNCIKHVSKYMLKQKSGKIINISSVVGLVGNIGQINYAASKAGLLGITKSAAKELSSRGITVNAVAPGFIQTDMVEELGEKVKDSILENIPLKRLGKAEEIAYMVAFLASDQANYITGQVFNVDGGMVM